MGDGLRKGSLEPFVLSLVDVFLLKLSKLSTPMIYLRYNGLIYIYIYNNIT